MDASLNRARAVVGIGLVLHGPGGPGRDGPVHLQYAEAYNRVDQSVMEEFAILRALEIGQALGVRRIKVRSDYNFLRRRLKALHAAQEAPVGGGLRPALLLLASTFIEVAFALQPRRKNQAAHNLARYGREFAEVGPRLATSSALDASSGIAVPLLDQSVRDRAWPLR